MELGGLLVDEDFGLEEEDACLPNERHAGPTLDKQPHSRQKQAYVAERCPRLHLPQHIYEFWN